MFFMMLRWFFRCREKTTAILAFCTCLNVQVLPVWRWNMPCFGKTTAQKSRDSLGVGFCPVFIAVEFIKELKDHRNCFGSYFFTQVSRVQLRWFFACSQKPPHFFEISVWQADSPVIIPQKRSYSTDRSQENPHIPLTNNSPQASACGE
ncbi:MAG: hypothetical protein J5532_08255 [Lachnospiraceae bacterium]|nr:hypothetical protein [Lachnospiraceae bacterium]